MEPARQELETAIKNTRFSTPVCPIYQNVDAQPYTDPAKIQENLIAQLTCIGQMDTDHEKYDCRRSYLFPGNRTGQSITRPA